MSTIIIQALPIAIAANPASGRSGALAIHGPLLIRLSTGPWWWV